MQTRERESFLVQKTIDIDSLLFDVHSSLPRFGYDLTTTCAMELASVLNEPLSSVCRELAQGFAAKSSKEFDSILAKVTIAENGYLNFRLSDHGIYTWCRSSLTLANEPELNLEIAADQNQENNPASISSSSGSTRQDRSKLVQDCIFWCKSRLKQARAARFDTTNKVELPALLSTDSNSEHLLRCVNMLTSSSTTEDNQLEGLPLLEPAIRQIIIKLGLLADSCATVVHVKRGQEPGLEMDRMPEPLNENFAFAGVQRELSQKTQTLRIARYAYELSMSWTNFVNSVGIFEPGSKRTNLIIALLMASTRFLQYERNLTQER